MEYLRRENNSVSINADKLLKFFGKEIINGRNAQAKKYYASA